MYALKRMHVSLKLLPIRDSLKGSEPSVRMKKKNIWHFRLTTRSLEKEEDSNVLRNIKLLVL